MTVENWPGRGYYRGNKQAMLSDAAKLFGGTMIATPVVLPTSTIDLPKPLDPPHVASTILPTKLSTDQAKQMGYTGNECQTCGSSRMKIAGHCEVCEECGASSGCS